MTTVQDLIASAKSQIEEISVDDMYNIISKAKPSRTVGDDTVSMDLIKQIPSLAAKVTSYLFNTMIKKENSPAV